MPDDANDYEDLLGPEPPAGAGSHAGGATSALGSAPAGTSLLDGHFDEELIFQSEWNWIC